MRKVFLDNLPRWRFGEGQINGVIDWFHSTGYKVRFIYDDIEGWLEILDYVSKGQIVTIKYLDKPIFKIQTTRLLDCQLGNLLNIHTGNFKIEIGTTLKDEKRDMVITNREYRKIIGKKDIIYKWYKYTCNKCGWTEGWVVESSLLGQKAGCGCCCVAPQKTVLGYNTIWDKARWMVDLGVSVEDSKSNTPQSSNKVAVTCPNCGKEKTMIVSSINKNKSISCTCSDKISYPNKFAYSLLEQLNEIYKFDCLEREYSPDWIGRRKYDNYFRYNGKEYILEMDGLWHKVDNKMSGQTKEESKANDDEKDLRAREHGIEVIRINCEESNLEFIKQNIIIDMPKIFDLNKINWLKCEESALSNLVKLACDLWNEGIHSTVEMGGLLKLSRCTIIRYLKKGQRLGWCNYNAKEEMRKSGKRAGGINRKQIICLETKKVFESATDCAKQSEEVFGVKLDTSNISSVCIGKRKHHKGFTFKYINEIEQAI